MLNRMRETIPSPLPHTLKKKKTFAKSLSLIFLGTTAITSKKILGGGGGGVNKVHYGLCENGKQAKKKKVTPVVE